MITLAELGPRIGIIGPSSSGKSTLADQLAGRLGCPVAHLDQLAHRPFTSWQRRDDAEFVALHDDFIKGEAWVMDGNYGVCMPQRLARATAVIWLDPPLLGCIARYIKRCWQNDGARKGGLEGAETEFSFALIKFTLVTYPKNRLRYARMLQDTRIKPLMIRSMNDLNRYKTFWNL